MRQSGSAATLIPAHCGTKVLSAPGNIVFHVKIAKELGNFGPPGSWFRIPIPKMNADPCGSGSATLPVPGDIVLLVQIAKELGPRDKLSHQGEEAHEAEGRAHEKQEHAHNRHAGVEEGQVEAVHACHQKTQVNSPHEI